MSQNITNSLTQMLEEQRRKTVHNEKQLMQIEESEDAGQKVHIEVEAETEAESKAKAKAEKVAILKVTRATLEGIKKGETASLKLHADAKVQTEAQTTEAIGKLKDKYDSTKKQVVEIVHNFGNIHRDL